MNPYDDDDQFGQRPVPMPIFPNSLSWKFFKFLFGLPWIVITSVVIVYSYFSEYDGSILLLLLMLLRIYWDQLCHEANNVAARELAYFQMLTMLMNAEGPEAASRMSANLIANGSIRKDALNNFLYNLKETIKEVRHGDDESAS